MEITTHQAELCMNELAKSAKPWFDVERFNIIKNHMESYSQKKLAPLNAEIQSERQANSILTQENEKLEVEKQELINALTKIIHSKNTAALELAILDAASILR